MKYLINMSYDGSKFYGYQIQNNELTIEGELEKALSKIFNEKINTIGASRTDKGVHAIDQYAHFETNKFIKPSKLTNSLNKMINKSIYIKSIKKVSEEFSARYSVLNKEYIYKINMGKYNPIEKDYVLQYNKKIPKELLDKFVYLLSGEHDFRSFTSDNDKDNYIRDIKIDYKISKGILYLKFSSIGFLRYMIRNIVGLLLDINDNKKSINDINNIFKDKNRTSLGKCANAEGLYLNKINYI